MYLIKKTYNATESNTNFFGTEASTQIWICGKNGWGTLEGEYNRAPLFYAKEMAYSTKASAMRGLKACEKSCDWENNIGNWKVSCELFEA